MEISQFDEHLFSFLLFLFLLYYQRYFEKFTTLKMMLLGEKIHRFAKVLGNLRTHSMIILRYARHFEISLTLLLDSATVQATVWNYLNSTK